MRVSEVVHAFQSMSACERLYLLCQLLHKCIAFEIRYLAGFLGSLLQNDPDVLSLSKHEADANKADFFSRLEEKEGMNGILCQDGLSKMCCGLALLGGDNKAVGEVVYKMLYRESLLSLLQQTDNMELVEDVRLVYVMAVYHPSLSFEHRNNLMTILQQLDTIYADRVQKGELPRGDKMTTAADGDSVLQQQSEPSSDAVIVNCSVHGVYKRLSDKRYPYIIRVEWNDGSLCHVHRTYGDFFSFQNKLLDLFPEESGQRHKKQRVIPFLPGRKLLSGKSNRELAEKRLSELWQYTHDLFELPDHITHCQHIIEFFRPRQSDFKDHKLPLYKMTSLSDLKGKSRHPSAPSALLLPSPSSSPALQRVLNTGRAAHTLPYTNNPADKSQESPQGRRSTLPARAAPSAFTPVSPATSGEWIRSSESSLGSSEQLNPSNVAAAATTVPCTVVTPPTSRTSGSPAFSVGVSPLASSTTLTCSTGTTPTATTVTASPDYDLQQLKMSSTNWADRSDPPPPPTIDETFYSSRTNISPTNSIGSAHRSSIHGYVPYSPSPATSPILSPKPHTPRGYHSKGSRTPTCHTPTETDPFSKWLKVHRLHKYSNIFHNLTFEEISVLTVEQLKDKGMTQGAAKKLWQKMDELKKNNVSSFREIPITSISRKPSTSSLPASLLLADRMLTPSNSIEQLSLYSSTCSLDTFVHPVRLSSHPRASSEAVLVKSTAEMTSGSLVNGGGGEDITSPDSIDGSSQPCTPRGAYHTENPVPRLNDRSPSIHSASDISLTLSPTQQLFSPSNHLRKDLSPPTSDETQQLPIRIPQPLVPPGSNRMGLFIGPGWSPAPMIRGRVIVAPSNLPMIRPTSQFIPYGAAINGLLPTPGAGISPVTRLGAYPPPTPPGVSSLTPPPSSGRGVSQMCYNCGRKGHHGASCPVERPHSDVQQSLHGRAGTTR